LDLLKRPLAEYLQHRVGAQAVLISAERFTRGTSRVTWFVDYRASPEGPLETVVFRGDHAGGSTIPTSLEQEYFMYERLSATDVPVARTRWWEGDPAWVDRPFYVRDRIEGSWDVPHYLDPDPQYDAMRIAISKEHLRKLAIVHRVDWRRLGFGERLTVPPNEAACAECFIDDILQRMASFAEEPVPLVIEAAAWLKQRAPVAPCISLCKGTNGLGEEIFRDGVIVAMSDWEEASIGDPAADFASLQSFIPEIVQDGKVLWGMDAAVDYYREVSGIDLTVDAVRYYQIVRALGTIQYGQRAAVTVHHGQADIRKAWTGTEIFHLGKRMLSAAIGIAEPIEPSWFQELNETIQ
jgi:aminoglycoside phosphotransferase (APT) family kinase protein